MESRCCGSFWHRCLAFKERQFAFGQRRRIKKYYCLAVFSLPRVKREKTGVFPDHLVQREQEGARGRTSASFIAGELFGSLLLPWLEHLHIAQRELLSYSTCTNQIEKEEGRTLKRLRVTQGSLNVCQASAVSVGRVFDIPHGR